MAPARAGHFLLLALAFAAFLLILIPPARESPYFSDDYRNFSLIEDITSNPLAAWLPDKDNRRHPLYFYSLVPQFLWFGPEPTFFFLTVFIFHFLSAVLIMVLGPKLGLSPPASLFAGLFFLCSSAFYQTLLTINGRPLLLVLFLLTILVWISFLEKERRGAIIGVYLLQIFSLLLSEEVITFPFIASLITWKFIPGRERRNRLILTYLVPLLLLDGTILFFLTRAFFLSPHHIQRVSIAALGRLPEKFISLFEMLARPLLVPEKGFLHENPFWDQWLRLAPACAILAMGWFFFLRRGGIKAFLDGIPRPAFYPAPLQRCGVYFFLGWGTVAALPFTLQPLGFEHASRYLYFPFAGFSMAFGAIYASLWKVSGTRHSPAGKIFLIAVLVYILFLNLNTTAYHFGRYRHDAEKDPQMSYTDTVRDLLKQAQRE